MAVAKSTRIETFPELRGALVAWLERFQGTFPTPARARKIKRVRSGERIEMDATTLWSAAFGQGLPIADELFLACHEQLVFVLTEDDELIAIGVDETAQKPMGKPNRYRHAANSRWRENTNRRG